MMKLRFTLLIFLAALILSACNFSLAEDITPPPNYVPPTPMPTLGPLFPARAPNLQNGAAIYAEKCVECHGLQGMGDGEKGKQLPVTVAALGLPQVARAAAPADWYGMVTRGNIERFMPPFTSLDEQQRWDVIAYALSLHADEATLARGKELFETGCANCPLDRFQDQEAMASLSAEEIVALLKNGADDVTALPGNLTDEDYYAVAAWLRSLTFAPTLPPPTTEPAAPSPTGASLEATPPANETPAAETSATPVANEPAGAQISGSVSGKNISGLTVTLRGFDHAAAGDPASGATQENVTLTTVTDAKGAYEFAGLEFIENRIFFAEVEYLGVTYSSDVAVFAADTNTLALPTLTLYEATEDYSALSFDQAHFFLDVSDETLQVIGVYTFKNSGAETVVITTPMDVPFIKTPPGAENVGFDLTQDSAPIVAAGDSGFAMPPSETAYGFVAFYTLPYTGKTQIQQPFELSASSVVALVPDGIKASSEQLTEGEAQSFQGANYRSYSGAGMKSGDMLVINLSGQPKSAGATDSRQGLLIGIGALGGMLILAGAWLYLRERGKTSDNEADDEDGDEDGMKSDEDFLDAIIALDDLHRAGKIGDEAYQARRAELKARLRDVM